ncbi:hypothetical protein DL96DRAFT_905110 [Flagelloscypha sp. PMI_526]|nr:hypothetical protein DL96DRAFT_905110 [Flagelloscypha sp. PMI_526]
MHVTVQITSRYSTRNIRVNVDAFDTIESLRSMLEVQEGLKTHAQGHLTLDGRVLLDNVLLTTLNLDTDSTSKRVLHLAGYQFQVVLKSITGRNIPITVSSNLPISDIFDIMLEHCGPAGPYPHESVRLIAPRIGILPLYRSAEDILLRPGTLIYCVYGMREADKPLYVSLWDWDGRVEVSGTNQSFLSHPE